MDKDHSVSLGLAYLQDLRWAFIRSHAATVAVAVGVVPSFLPCLSSIIYYANAATS